jgi:tetratricopeptide (TPR) repeat protein
VVSRGVCLWSSLVFFAVNLSCPFSVYGLTENQTALRRIGQESNAPRPTPTPNIQSPARNIPTREERAQAYAKLLEGQRYLAEIRRTRDFDGPVLIQALAAFAEAARLYPALAEAHTALAEIHFFNGELDRAAEETRLGIAADQNNFGAHRLLSRILILRSGLREGSLNRPIAEQAIGELREVVRLLPTDSEAWALLGEFYALTGRAQEAIEAFNRWAAAPRTLETQFYSHVTQGRELTPDAANARLGEFLLRAGRYNESVAAFRRAAALDPDNLGYVELLGRALIAAGNDQAVVTIYTELLAALGITNEPPTSEQGRRIAGIALGNILAAQKRTGQMGAARATIERMRSVLGEAPAEIARVELLRDQGQRQEALAAAQAARPRFPDEIRFVRLEALLLAELNRVDEGATLLRGRLTGATRNDYEEYLWLAEIYLRAGRGRESADAARGALEIAENLRVQRAINQALVILASGQERAGERAGAEQSLRRVLQTEPNNATALNNLGYFFLQRNERLSEALETIQRAVQIEPQNPSFLDSLGWAYFKLGQFEEAERYLTEAARRDPSSRTIQEHLGDLYFRTGRTTEARAAWQRALTLSFGAAEVARLRAKINEGQVQ